ncbi:hybrid sensor histidine kinase/response regulator transcription factor [Pedobacter sp. AW31-3R]|uniref:hybrid sensor histidine kinase/response regulator transcription factor n=1 Tax=Pedobacter sp. AW31-3R TaxID=3445781 RepID=UPI003FA0183E
MCGKLGNYLLVFILAVFSGQLFGAEHIPYTTLGIEKGLSNNAVRCIFKDAKGFMWFGTHDGLNRYDGYEFKIYRNQLGDKSSLPHNYIYAINEDRNHNLWVGTGQGIGILNPLSNKFTPAYYKRKSDGMRMELNCQINRIKTAPNGDILIATNGSGLLVTPVNDENAVSVAVQNKDGKLINAYNVTDIKISGNKNVFMFIERIGLCVYDTRSRKIRVIDRTVSFANCIEPEEGGHVWMCSPEGLYRYDYQSRKTTRMDQGKSNLSNAELILSVRMDKYQNLWMGTKADGLKVFNASTGKTTWRSLEGPNNSQSVTAIFEDERGRKWIGTSKDGIYIFDTHHSRFKTISQQPQNRSGLINNFVSAFFEQPDGKIWIGTDAGGISIWNRPQNVFTNLKAEAGNPHSLSNNAISMIRKDYLGDIWIATYGGGINKVNPDGRSFKHYKCINEYTGFENENVWQLLESHDRVLWATTFSHGTLYYFNRSKDRFEVFDKNLEENLLALKEDRHDVLWGGNASSLIRIDRQAKNHTAIDIGKPVRVIHEDRYGNFWLGTEGGGLILFNRKTMKVIKRFSTVEGLCNNSILSIVEDKGNLWLSTFSGLSKFDIKRQTFLNFYQDDGLQSNQFLDNSSLKLRSGELVFGGLKGFNIFHPDSIQSNGIVPPILITGIRINNMPISSEDEYVLKTTEHQVEELKIPYGEAAITVDFAALEYTVPGKISYAYYMEGWDKGWNYSNKIRTAAYTNLADGNYKLHIKSTNTDGAWADNEKIILVHILPPWYRSWVAYFFYTICALGAGYIFIDYQKRQSFLKYQIDLANLRVEQEKEMSENKLTFFTNISHEFRTPLTLIINPIKEFLNSKNGYVDPKELIIVYRNARRLLNLVDQLLSFRKSETQKLKVSKFNFVTFSKEIFACFAQQAKAKHINFELLCSAEEIEIFGDREKLEIVLFNLIANAFKFTPKGGAIKLRLLLNEKDLEIQVSDTGMGIAEDAGSKIFDRFYQEAKQHASSGFGIGLFLVKNLVEAHHGTVSYSSVPGEGTDFRLNLLLGSSHFKADEILEYTPDMEGSGRTEDNNYVNDICQIEEPESSAGNPLSVEPTTEKKAILIVEDNADIRNYVKKIFEKDYLVYEAANGNAGETLVRKYVPDIVITDVMMDEGNGLDLCTSIKSNPELSHIPVIILTSSSSSEIKLKGIELGADDFITKPFDKDILIARVANLLKSRNALQQYFLNEITLKSDDFKVSKEYKEFLEKCISITEKHMDNPDFNVKTLADELATSPSLLYKKVKAISGKTTNEFIRYIRLRKAAQLLINSDYNINQTALLCGFNDIRYFREQFNKVFGIRPSDYIKKYRNNLSDKHRVIRDF